MIQTNNKPITTKHTDVNRALQDIYNIVNKLASSVNSQAKPSARFKGDIGDLRVNDNGFQYHNGKGWQTIALAADNEQYTPVVTNALQSSGITYPIADGTAGQSIITDGSKKLSFESHLPLTGGTLSGNLKITSAVSARPIFTIENTFTGATSGGITFLKNKGAAGVDDDAIGSILFTSDNTEQELTDFAKIIAEVSEATDGDEAGRLSFLVAESNDSTSQLTAGLVLEGEHATDGEVDVTIAAGASSTTAVAGRLNVAGIIHPATHIYLDAKLFLDGGSNTYIWESSADHIALVPGGVTTLVVDNTSAKIGANQYMTLTDNEIDVSSGNLTVDSAGSIILDSATGAFEMHGAGATAKFADMYAGTILGYRVVGLNETHAYLSLTTSYVVPTDEFGVTFVAPPSGNVEYEIQGFFYGGTAGRAVYASLSTENNTVGAPYTQLADEYEQAIIIGDTRFAYRAFTHKWVETGLTAGASTSRFAAFKTDSTSGTPKVLWGGNSANRYPDFIMKVTALPATIST